jgi:hypothetical protein
VQKVSVWLGSKSRKFETAVSNCIDLGQLLHLEPTHLVWDTGTLVVGFQVRGVKYPSQ